MKHNTLEIVLEDDDHDSPNTPLTRGQFANPEDFERFINGGKAVFTVHSHATGKHFTYRVVRKQEATCLWVFFLNGPNNDDDGSFAYLGTIFDDTRAFRLTKKSRAGADAPVVRGFNWLWNQIVLAHNTEQWSKADFLHEGRCGCCGRRLTEPESIACGIGPVCRGRA